jgi:hypothetical protein
MNPSVFMNDMSWANIADFLSLRKVKLDYATDSTAYPPVLPHHCYWKHLTLCECLDDLLKNFECRVLSKTNEDGTPIPDDYLNDGFDDHFDGIDVVTDLVWKRRQKIVYRDDINYDKILWPVYDREIQTEEDNSVIYFKKLSSFFGFSSDLFQEGLYPTVQSSWDANRYMPPNSGANFDIVKRSAYDFICNLYPYSDTYFPDNFAEINLYLKENHVNVDTDYRFTTDTLPPDFYEESEWSKITLQWENDNYEFLVEHLPRPCWFPNEIATIPFNAIVEGTVASQTGYIVTFSYLRDITNNILMPANTAIEFSNNNTYEPGDEVTLGIYGDSIRPIGLVRWDEEETEMIELLYNGDIVDSITWEIVNWNEYGSAGTCQHCDPEGAWKVFNYVVEGVSEREPNAEWSFGTQTYEIEHPTGYAGTNINEPLGTHQIIITFVMEVAEDDRKQAIVDYLTHRSVLVDVEPENREFQLNMWAERWLHFYERITICVGLTKNVLRMDMYYAPYEHDSKRLQDGINPDIDPYEFSRTYLYGSGPPDNRAETMDRR